jgi:hypothetical protein
MQYSESALTWTLRVAKALGLESATVLPCEVMRDSLDETAACRVGREMLRQHDLLKLP